jgi:hypothetical protein
MMQCKRKERDQFEICVSRNRNPTGHTQEFFGFDGGPYPTPQEGLAAKRASERVKKKNSPQEPIRKGELFRRSASAFVSQTEEQESRIEMLEGTVEKLNLNVMTLQLQVKESMEWMKVEREEALTPGKGKGKGSKTGKGKGKGQGKGKGKGPSTSPTTKKKQNNSNGSSSTISYANHSCWAGGGDGYGYWDYGHDADYQHDHY